MHHSSTHGGTSSSPRLLWKKATPACTNRHVRGHNINHFIPFLQCRIIQALTAKTRTLRTMVVFSGEVISSYAVPRKPFWGLPELERTMRCLGGIMNVCIEEELRSENRRTIEGGDVERAVVEDREIFRGLGAAIALLAFRGTRSDIYRRTRVATEEAG